MDHDKLRTASIYLNNLLLARGLLRNGEPVDFVKPSKESRAQIINLVHDLILREDRDKEQREHVAAILHTLRAEDARKGYEIERFTAKCEESARSSAQAQTSERVALAEVKKVEKAMKTLQDQTSKLKASLAQVKAQCTTDVRKKDLELARLKTHLQSQQRGTRVGMPGPSMTVRRTMDKQGTPRPADKHDLRDPEYSLKQETNEFLTQLSQSLSDENDNLINLIRNVLSTMRDLLGVSASVNKHPDSALGSMGSDHSLPAKRKEKELVQVLPSSYNTLSQGMETMLEHVKNLLTNPNFVSVDEVEIREEEITRLRGGWERMEQRWRDVLRMMEDWRKRMDTGDVINIEELRRGIGMVSPGRAEIMHTNGGADESMVASEISEIRLPGGEADQDSGVLAPEPPRHMAPLGGSSPKRKRDVLEPPVFFDVRPSRRSAVPPHSPPKPHAQHDTIFVDEGEESEELEVPKMSIEEKLSAAQVQAEEAMAARSAASRIPTKSGPQSERGSIASAAPGSIGGAIEDNTLGKMPSPVTKRTRIRGRPRKRKSTLSPDELEALINNADAE